MHPSKFGDTYDIVKQSLLTWLAPCGTWAVDPMFAQPVSTPFVENFSRFLGVPLVTTKQVPSRQAERMHYFEAAIAWRSTDHLFLDPDTGIAMSGGGAGRERLKVDELVRIAEGRSGSLVLVFDMSFARNRDREEQAKKKLSCLREHGVHALAYCSHANFVIASSDARVLENAMRTLKEASRLPDSRFIKASAEDVFQSGG